MQTLYVPKYNLHYRVNPRNPRELQWSRKPFGPATQWQHAMSFKNPIRALDLDDETKQGVVVLNDSTTYVGSGVRTWGRKFYPAGTRIYSLYAIGESTEKKPMSKLKIKVREAFGAPSTPKELKNEKAIKEWYGDKVSRVQMTDEVYAILHPSESKKCERLSDYGYDDIVKEIAGEVEHTFADEEIYDTTSKYDVKVALAKALRTWAPDLLLNIAEDAMEKLGYFAKDYDAFMSVVNDAVGDALND